jgi:hypothetical protein
MIKVLLFREHKDDPLGAIIRDVTREPYTHAALLVDPVTNTISEAYFPHVRRRQLDNTELGGIDVYYISTTFPVYTELLPGQAQAIAEHCAKSEAEKEGYSITNLFRFLPGFSKLIGDAVDNGDTSKVFCSQYVIDSVATAGIRLLNAPGYMLAPGYLSWSPLLLPAPALLPLVKLAA